MIISDLDYVELGDPIATSHLLGSLDPFPSVFTSAIASTKPGFAYADANAFATGQTTYTATRVYANTIVNPAGKLSFALASAIAYASGSYGSLRSRSDYFAFSITTSVSISSANFSAALSLA